MKTNRSGEKAFFKAFNSPCEFWTSEDGMLMSLVIRQFKDAAAMLKQHWVFDKERFDRRRMKRRFVERQWAGGEFFDGNSGISRGKIWVLTDEKTPFPVIEYELRIPR